MFDYFALIRVFALSTVSFVAAVAWTPLLTRYLYKFKLGKTIRDEKVTPVFSAMHKKKSGTPVMGGLLVWVTTLVLALLLYYLAQWTDIPLFDRLNFLSRSQTWLPLGALVASAIVGMVDDLFNIWRLGHGGNGLKVSHRFIIYSTIAIVGAYWFFVRLGWSVIHVPFWGDFEIGMWYIPLFIFIIVATAFSVNEIDGLDGLAGGTLMAAFATYAAIAFMQGRYDLATFCGVITGALMAFLWFNIYPARFFMGDTGAMSLGITLGIVAMLTNTALFLPVIGFLFVIESLSVIIQVLSKKIRKKKVFRSAPLHHHLEAIGWPEPKIVMRFWVISCMTAAVGFILFLLDRGLF